MLYGGGDELSIQFNEGDCINIIPSHRFRFIPPLEHIEIGNEFNHCKQMRDPVVWEMPQAYINKFFQRL